MATKRVLLDTTLLIEFLRKRNKNKTVVRKMSDEYLFDISVLSRFEVEIGLKSDLQRSEYRLLLGRLTVLPLDQPSIEQAVETYTYLRRQNRTIELPDLLIGATALRHRLPVATLNKKHFSRIPHLDLLDLSPYFE